MIDFHQKTAHITELQKGEAFTYKENRNHHVGTLQIQLESGNSDIEKTIRTRLGGT